MNQVQKFQFGLMDLRVLDLDGQPWFVGNDVCYALGLNLKAHGYAIQSLDPDQRSLYRIQKGVRSQSIISESGLYKLVMRSDKPDARAFQGWVTRVVLPAIRKDGSYVLGENSHRRTTGYLQAFKSTGPTYRFPCPVTQAIF
jgi:prophage antirepressor-like protein